MKGQLHIDEVFAFIVIDDDGTEGVPAVRLGEDMVVPMMGADMARVESFREAAESIAKQMNRPITLVKFSQREEVEVIT